MNMTLSELQQKHCRACEPGTGALGGQEVERLVKELAGWVERDKGLERVYKFKNYYETMAFVNAVAWIAHTEDHHPDLTVGYNMCKVRYSTHSVGGLSENDFICAAKVEKIMSI